MMTITLLVPISFYLPLNAGLALIIRVVSQRFLPRYLRDFSTHPGNSHLGCHRLGRSRIGETG
ncbi:MAG: hypothetical protein M2R45_05317 [Verrucomicrobia subdivision 3 bacterium]|nr:hypothetical protein [Limisphaerales bacterium]MCS1415713.1 hypothetical protein [Limisphaerales bacterium]